MTLPSGTLHSPWGALPAKGRIAAIDELKGLAILLIIAFHTELALGLPPRSQGFIGVDVFLLLSGWTICRSLRPDERAATFFRKRMLRVFPAYWVALVLFGVIKVGLLEGGVDFRTLLIHAFALQAFVAPAHFFALNPSFWFMSLLLIVYPLAYLSRKETSPYAWITLGIGSATLIYAIATWLGHESLRVYLPARIVSFSLGYALALAGRPQTAMPSGATLCAVVTLGAFYLESRGVFLVSPALFAACICITFLLLRGGVVNTATSNKPWLIPLGALGAISYEVFLLHQPLLRLSMKVLHLPETIWARLASASIGIVVAISAAWLLHQLLSRPRRAAKPVTPIVPAASST